MYLTENQLQLILNNSFFTQPVTVNKVKYAYYRGRLNAEVHTLRFNVNDPNFNNNFLIQHAMDYLFANFPMNTQLLGSISYDLILVNPNNDSYYIWRANSNSTRVDDSQDTKFALTYNNAYRFLTQGANIDVPTLNINFQTSNVSVERAIAIVFSFTLL